jgi:hypothetical protein
VILLQVQGVRGAEDAASAEAALRACDPALQLRPDWAQGLLEIRSSATADALRLALQEAGFIAASLQHRPVPVTAAGVLGLVWRIAGFGLLGLLGGMVAGIGLGLLAMATSACRVSGDAAAGCAMGIPVIAFFAGLAGCGAGMLFGLVSGLRRARRAGGG